MRFLALACALVVAGTALPASAQTEIKSICFCQAGNNPKQFTAEIELTDANRTTVRKLIEDGELDLRKTVKITGNGCVPAAWRKNRLCGQTSVSTTKPDGKRESQNFDNTPVTGTKTLRITHTGNIPRKRGTPPKPFIVDDEQWPKVQVILVGGTGE